MSCSLNAVSVMSVKALCWAQMSVKFMRDGCYRIDQTEEFLMNNQYLEIFQRNLMKRKHVCLCLRQVHVFHLKSFSFFNLNTKDLCFWVQIQCNIKDVVQQLLNKCILFLGVYSEHRSLISFIQCLRFDILILCIVCEHETDYISSEMFLASELEYCFFLETAERMIFTGVIFICLMSFMAFDLSINHFK